MIVSVHMATSIVVLALILLVLPPIGHLEVLAVGLVIMEEGMAMIMILMVVLVAVVVSLVIGESLLMAILVALVPMEDLVGAMVQMA